MSIAAEFHRTQQNQRDASDPSASAWVIANAGSGKTHVLTQRVIRLLLSGADPAAILCLTFTKVAAAEMAARVFGQLGAWATLPAKDLKVEIAKLQGRGPTNAELTRARQLFAHALETPGGLKIQTIHAFCERLLHQFPFEANVPGQFSVLDDNSAAALIAEAREKVIDRAAAEPASRLGQAMRHLAETTSDAKLDEALDAVIAERDQIRRWIELSGQGEASSAIDHALTDLRHRLDLAADETEESICREICETVHWRGEDCRELIAGLTSARSANERNLRDALQSIVDTSMVAIEADLRIALFLTDSDGLKCRQAGNRLGAALLKGHIGLKEKFDAEADRLLRLADRLNRARAFAATHALLVVGDAILEAYHAAKRQAGMLDFADLIAKTRTLLSRADASDWVLYKLDRRLEHILVDEAQDTSADQWQVVKALAEDFFSGGSAVESERTIFAVGDDKQSIFSFQGAAPEMLADMRRAFEEKMRDAGRAFVTRPLFLSFRSTREVLQAVDKVFGAELADQITGSPYEEHFSSRDDLPGRVVIMPRIVRRKAADPEDWTEPYDAPSAAETTLADNIATEIGRIRNSVLPSGKTLHDGEILVLVRRRDAFAAAMTRALRTRQIPAAGADRIPIATHIAVQDLLALADVMLLPQDNLQLAACLKSPLVGLDEDALMRLAMHRHASLWSTLRNADEPVFRTAFDRLARWRKMADQVTPFRFFATILGPDHGRRAFRARLGGEADDVLDTFLSETLAYERVEPPTLQGFVRFIRANEKDIKREAEEAAGGVRIMTVHGAKGLEADVVFLVDTGGLVVVPGQRDTLVPIGRDRDDPAFLWRRNAKEQPDLQRDADAKADERTKREYLRLLYVAMTRARDMLYIAGIRGERTPSECWYQRVIDALVPEDVARDPKTGELAQPCVWPKEQRPPQRKQEEQTVFAFPDGGEGRPAWLEKPAVTQRPAPQPLRPSQALAEPDRAFGPSSDFRDLSDVAAAEALSHGRAVHRLLRILPGISPDLRGAVAHRLFARELSYAPDKQAARREAEAVIDDPALAHLFSPGARAEAAIVGRLATTAGSYAVSGRIDRLVQTATGWELIDFKTSRRVPSALDEIDPADILQIALYRRLLQDIDPEKPIRASLLWTAQPNIMPIARDLMEQALEKLGICAIGIP